MPAYEVATIKPPEPNGYAAPLRVYIQSAFGLPGNSIGWVIGPDWINSAKYVIRGKPSEAMQQVLQGSFRFYRMLRMPSIHAEWFYSAPLP